MFFFLLIVYSLSLFFLFFDLNIFFINEEFLIFISMSILFALLTSSTKKFIKFNLFFRIEFIYFFFIYLITLNIKLINKLLGFISFENLKLNSLILADIYNFYNESINEITRSGKLINSFLVKNIILLLNSNIFFSYILTTSSDFFIRFCKIRDNFFQYFDLRDINYNFFFNSLKFNSLSRILVSGILYISYSKSNIRLNCGNIIFVNNSTIHHETNKFIKNLTLNFLK